MASRRQYQRRRPGCCALFSLQREGSSRQRTVRMLVKVSVIRDHLTGLRRRIGGQSFSLPTLGCWGGRSTFVSLANVARMDRSSSYRRRRSRHCCLRLSLVKIGYKIGDNQKPHLGVSEGLGFHELAPFMNGGNADEASCQNLIICRRAPSAGTALREL